MKKEKLDHVLRTVDPSKRLFLKKFVLGAGFAVPIVASFSLKDMALAGTVTNTTTLTTPLPCTSTVVITNTVTTGTTTTTTHFVTTTQ